MVVKALLLIRLAVGLALLSFGSVSLAQTQASLESPSSGSFQESGVSLIRGWACQASKIEISIDNGPLQAAAYGTTRPDTQAACGDTNNGFGLTINWGNTGEGNHTLRGFANGVQFAEVNFVITTLGGSFLTKLIGEYTLKDFPTPGSSPTVAWSEPHQNFVLTKKLAVPASPIVPSNPRAALESPTQGSSESGVSLIRGWVCEASRVEVSIDGGPRLQTAYGTERTDTQATCADSNNGFGLTYNWNEIGDGVHNLRAFTDNVEFANVNFAVTTLGGKFLTGLSSKQTLEDFPGAEQTTTVSWSEPHQNFVIAKTTATEPKVGILSAITDRLNRFAVTNVGTESSDVIGVAATKGSAGEATELKGLAWTDTDQNVEAEVELTTSGLPMVYRDSSGVEARFSNLTATTTTVSLSRNGVVQGQPVEVEINVGFLQSLQTVANRIVVNARSASVNDDLKKRLYNGSDPQRQAQASGRSVYTLEPLLINAQWYGGLTTGEMLCAVQNASAKVGILSQIATKGCQSKLIKAVQDRAKAVRRIQADFAPDVVDPAAQQSLQFVADVAEAPCAENATSTECLILAATVVEKREETGEPIVPNDPGPTTPVAPATPSNVSASDGDFTDRVQITWGAVSGATYYQVYREGSLLGSPTQTSFDDSSANPGTTYSYSVAACNTAGCSSTKVDKGFVQTQQPTTYRVTATAGANGSISPSERTVNSGATATFTVTPNTGYSAAVSGCGGSLSGNTYTTGPITADCTVTASFSVGIHTITATAGANGSISPPSQTVNHGATATFTVTGYNATVSGCNGSLSGNTYTTGPITADCTVTASFTAAMFNVTFQGSSTAQVGTAYSGTFQATGGTAPYTWSPITALPPGLSCSFNGLVSGTPTTAGSYRFGVRLDDSNGDTANGIVTITVQSSSYQVTAIAGPGGSVSPSERIITSGATTSFTVTPNAGYTATVSGCGGSLSGNTYTTGPITADCTVTASFTYVGSSFIFQGSTTAQVGVAYSGVFQATGIPNPPYTFSHRSGPGPLPPGLVLSASGSLSGTPTQVGSYTFGVEVLDALGRYQVDRIFNITVSP